MYAVTADAAQGPLVALGMLAAGNVHVVDLEDAGAVAIGGGAGRARGVAVGGLDRSHGKLL